MAEKARGRAKQKQVGKSRDSAGASALMFHTTRPTIQFSNVLQLLHHVGLNMELVITVVPHVNVFL